MSNPVLNIYQKLDLETFCRYTQVNDQTVLFLIIQFSMSTKLDGSKHCNVLPTIQLNISHLFKHG